MTLPQWIAAAIFASFPQGQRTDVARGALKYLSWLDTLPVVER